MQELTFLSSALFVFLPPMPPLSLFLPFLLFTTSSQGEVIFFKCSAHPYPLSILYKSILHRLVTNLTDSPPKSPLFYSAIYISGVFGFAQCRPDASLVACANCLRESSSMVDAIIAPAETFNGDCRRSISTAVYQDLCLLRYSNNNFWFSLDEDLVGSAFSSVNMSNPGDFSRRVVELMGRIALEASTAEERFAVGMADAGDAQNQNIYGMAWCTRDLQSNDCFQCLLSAVPKLSFMTVGGRYFKMSCLLRFEVYIFFDPSSIKLQTSPGVTGGGVRSDSVGAGGRAERSKTKRLLIIAISEGVALVLSCSVFIVLLLKKDKSSIVQIKCYANEEMRRDKSLLLDFGIISAATSNFSEEYKLGEGGFGPVYKGVLSDGQEIAVKRLSKTSLQGVVELKNEVAFVAKLQHRNLVTLLGCCLEKEEKLLVYEFLPNTSLDKHLFDPVLKILLDWGTRFKIIEGIAQGVLYLHEDSRVKVIHCDLKASNILLDSNMNPKISDFGLAKLFGIDEAQGSTIRISGTYGYMAPEYALRGFFSTKSDVYSYGVLVLEIVTGRRNICLDESVDSVDLIRFVWQNWKQGDALNAVDQSLGDRYMPKQALRCLHIGLLCIQEDPALRPSMASLVVMLCSYSFILPDPLISAFLI